MHHQFAIDHAKFMIEENGDDPKDFDKFKGYFIDHWFSTKAAFEN